MPEYFRKAICKQDIKYKTKLMDGIVSNKCRSTSGLYRPNRDNGVRLINHPLNEN